MSVGGLCGWERRRQRGAGVVERRGDESPLQVFRLREIKLLSGSSSREHEELQRWRGTRDAASRQPSCTYLLVCKSQIKVGCRPWIPKNTKRYGHVQNLHLTSMNERRRTSDALIQDKTSWTRRHAAPGLTRYSTPAKTGPSRADSPQAKEHAENKRTRVRCAENAPFHPRQRSRPLRQGGADAKTPRFAPPPPRTSFSSPLFPSIISQGIPPVIASLELQSSSEITLSLPSRHGHRPRPRPVRRRKRRQLRGCKAHAPGHATHLTPPRSRSSSPSRPSCTCKHTGTCSNRAAAPNCA